MPPQADMPSEAAMPPQAVLWQLSTGHYLPRCLHILAELDVAGHIGNTPQPIADIAAATQADADSLERMMRMVATAGVLAETDEGWVQTPLSLVLRDDQPGSMRSFVRMIGSPSQWSAAGGLIDTARTGKTALETVLGGSPWDYYRDHPEEGRIFDEAMTAKSHADIHAIRPVLDIAPFPTVADIGGGRGHFLAALLDVAPACHGLLVDLPDVIARAPAHPRMTGVSANFFTDRLPAADAYILSNVLHDWRDAECITILRAIRAAAPQHATLFILENLLPDDDQPGLARTLDIVMLAATGGRERTQAQYEALLGEAGFRLDSVTPVPGSIAIMTAQLN